MELVKAHNFLRKLKSYLCIEIIYKPISCHLVKFLCDKDSKISFGIERKIKIFTLPKKWAYCSAEMFGSDSASTETDKRRLALCKPSSAAGARSLVLRRENLHSRYGGGARAPRSHCAFFCNCQNVKLLWSGMLTNLKHKLRIKSQSGRIKSGQGME